MRRGLIAWSKDELPEAVLDTRVAALQAAMAAGGLDAIVAYTTPARAAAVSWIAGFVPYWNQGLVVVPREGRPILVSALSNRVNDWMRRNAHVADVRNAPRIGAEAGKHIAAIKPGASVGVVDLPHLPALVVSDMTAAGLVTSDASDLFRRVRLPADTADIALHERAAGIANAALAQVDASETEAARLVARIDGQARRLGAEEAYPAIIADLTRSLHAVRLEGSTGLGVLHAVRLSVAYKGAWVRVARTFSREASLALRIAEADRVLEQIVRGLPDTGALSALRWWVVEGTRTALPLEPLAGSMVGDGEPLQSNSIVSIQALIDLEGTPVLCGAPVLITAEGGRRLHSQ